jgi:hypothetical protein
MTFMISTIKFNILTTYTYNICHTTDNTTTAALLIKKYYKIVNVIP